VGAVAFCRRHCIAGSGFESGIGTKGAGETLRVDLAHMADTKGIEEPAQRNGTARVDGLIELAHRYGTEAIDLLQLAQRFLLALLQREDIGRRADRQRRIVYIEEELDLLFAQALDVEGVARDEVADAFDRLCRAYETARAAAHRLAFLADRMAAADGTGVREFKGLRLGRTLLQHDVDDLRDHVARALDNHRIADADVAALADRLAVQANALDVVLVVEGRVCHDHAADGDGFETRHGRQ